MGQILVHEFISLDGVFEAPRWTMEYGFDPKMGEAIGGIMGPCKAILLGARRSRSSPRRGRAGPPIRIRALRS